MCRSAYCFLRQQRQVVRSVSVDAVKTVVHAFISSRLDYCNSLLYVISDILLRRLQAVQSAAARLVTGTRRYDHIIQVWQQLHCLPVRQRVELSLCPGLQGAQQPGRLARTPYLPDDCELVGTTGRRQLRSSDIISSALSLVPVHVLKHLLLPLEQFMSVDLICPWTPSAAN